ncbi:hypothetical protein GY15_08730 [Delftia sp. 670]|nr:hypothetical protein GY15_08730 [Delftia sp. 670]
MGKQVRLNILGGTIEMDRGMLDRMMPAFEHLLRNCVAHGIEPPEQRTAAGKPAMGTIEIILSQERNDVALSVEDDGAGLNLQRIRDKAVAQGLWPEDQTLTEQDAGRLIFEPGFTTATEVTGVAGRGIGMDVVRSEVNALGGRIETHSEAGRGSAFRLVLPLTTAVTQVVMLRAGRLLVGVPASLVEIVRRAPLDLLQQAYASHGFEDGGETLPFYWAGALWQSSLRSEETVGRTRPVVILRSASQRIALHVDEVLGNQEVVIKNLGPQLARLPGLTGMSVLASGAWSRSTTLWRWPTSMATRCAPGPKRPSVPPARATAKPCRPARDRSRCRWCWWWTTPSPCAASPSACCSAKATAWPWRPTACRPWNAWPRSARPWCCPTSRCRAWTASTCCATSAPTRPCATCPWS